jgi:flagellar biosynthesis protein FliR
METIIAQAPYFMLVFVRIGAFMAFVPFFDNQNFIMEMKEGFAFLLALLIFPAITTTSWVIPKNMLGYAMMMGQEVLVGILIGFVFLLVLLALPVAGSLLGFQMAFTMANVIDTTFGDTSDVITTFVVLVGTMVAVTLGADHYLLYALGKSFEVLPPGTMGVSNGFIKDAVLMVTRGFEIGFRLASPALILLLGIDVTLSLIGKAAAKIQIFFVGLPLKIAVGLFCVTIILGFVVSIWGREVEKIPDYLLHFFKLARI